MARFHISNNTGGTLDWSRASQYANRRDLFTPFGANGKATGKPKGDDCNCIVASSSAPFGAFWDAPNGGFKPWENMVGLRNGCTLPLTQSRGISEESQMPSRSQANATVAFLVALVLIALISGIMLIPTVVATLQPGRGVSEAASTVTPTTSPALEKARAILARLRDDVIPREGLGTDYGVTFSDAGYETLIEWNADLKVEARDAGAFESLDLMLPCCDWSKPSRNEESNCACGHHQALEGLAKKLLSEGRALVAVQREVTEWSRYLYPKEALAAEMEKRAQLDPEIKAALEELKARGEC